MPLIKIFTRDRDQFPSVEELVPRLQEIWAVPAHIMKVLVIPVDEWSESASEDVFIDVRAKRTEARTHDVVRAAVEAMGRLFESHELKANVRVELYEPSLQHVYQSGGSSGSGSGGGGGDGTTREGARSSSGTDAIASSASSAVWPPTRRIDRMASRLTDVSSWRELARAAGGLPAGGGCPLQGEQMLPRSSCAEWMRYVGEALTSVALSWLLRTCMASNAQLGFADHSAAHDPRALLG